MNCEACLKEMQMAEDPANPGPEAAAHLAECLLCRTWLRQLVQIEHNVRRLPAPVSSPRAFLDHAIFSKEPPKTLLSIPVGTPAETEEAPVDESPAVIPLPAPAPAASAAPIRWSGRRWLTTLAGGLAAAGILITCGIFLGNMLSRALRDDNTNIAKNGTSPSPKEKKPSPRDDADRPPNVSPVVAKLLESDLQLAQTDSPRQRVKQLAKIADMLDGEAHKHTAGAAGPEVEKLAQLYVRVIHDGVVKRAKDLPREERREVLTDIVKQFEQTEKRAMTGVRETPAQAEPLSKLAIAARKGASQLRELMEEAAE